MLILLVIQTVAYFALTLHFRGRERARLAREWRAQEAKPQDQDDYVDDRMAQFADRLSLRLVLAVYILPLGVLGTIIYLTNSN